MRHVSEYALINSGKLNLDSLYTQADPREYFKYLGQLDYIIPHLAQPVVGQLIRARAETQSGPVTVLDLGCSYGVNGALMKYQVDFVALRQRYTAPDLQDLSSDQLLALDRSFYAGWPRNDGIRVVGLDISQSAIRYAEAAGTIDRGIAADFESRDPTPAEAEALANVDLIVSTGCVGYVTSRTFQRLARLARQGRSAWVASFVLRMFPYDEIEATLAAQGLVTEQFEGATFVQRRFADRQEMEATVRAVEARGIDTRGHEADGLFHADLFVSRSEEDVAACPVQRLVSVVSGANKPWRVSTNVLGSFGPAARRRAQAEQPRLVSGHAS
jgi:SAM-dependent methyltransferase